MSFCNFLKTLGTMLELKIQWKIFFLFFFLQWFSKYWSFDPTYNSMLDTISQSISWSKHEESQYSLFELNSIHLNASQTSYLPVLTTSLCRQKNIFNSVRNIAKIVILVTNFWNIHFETSTLFVVVIFVIFCDFSTLFINS